MAAEADPLLAVEDLTIGLVTGRTGRGPALVDRVSFTVRPGGTLGLVGESGCGKSITALALMGLLPTPPLRVTGGSARLMGLDLVSLPPAALRRLRGDRMAMIFQEPMTSLNPSLTIGEQIAESVRRHRGASKPAARARALEMLERVRVPAASRRLDDYPHQLSGGMRQRAMIAMALANDPALIIADEPTTALDVTIQAQILELLRTLQAEFGSALILITHDLGIVAEMADEVAVMYAGRMVEAGPTEALFADPQHPYTIGLISSLPSVGARVERLATIPGVVPAVTAMPAGCRFATRCPFRSVVCTETPPEARLGRQRVFCWHAPLDQQAAPRLTPMPEHRAVA